ncbi:MAG: 50S ribosomal protein L15 [Patescibacteria group bacterium]
MSLASNTIHSTPGSRKSSRRLGRGHGSGRGTSAGRGTKGQRARTGGRSRTAIRPFKRELQKVPKLSGFKSMYPKPTVVSLATLERICSPGDTVTVAFLREKGAVDTLHQVKVLSTGELTKSITLKGCLASKGAIAAIAKAGGNVVV